MSYPDIPTGPPPVLDLPAFHIQRLSP
jgi:hypothetical protein